MAKFKPQVTIITKVNQYKTLHYPTYKELVKNMKRHLEENLEANISVSRSRRGEGGEWYEIWEMIKGKPTIIKKGWQ